MRALRTFLVTLSAAALLVACQPGGDPASDDDMGAGGTGGQGAMGGEGGTGGDPDMGGMGGEGGEGGVGGEGGEGGVGGVGGMGGQGGEGGGGPPGFCPAEVSFVGQIIAGFEDMPMVPNGGVARFEPYDMAFDAGISAVLDAVPMVHQEVVDLSEAPIQVTEAVVIATNYYTDNFDVPPNQSRFWVADANGAVELFLDFNEMGATPEFQIRAGHKISFAVTEVSRYFASPQISKATDFTLVETDVEVYINENTPFMEDQVHQLVRVTGILRNEETCGADARCWDLVAPNADGSDGEVLGIYRTESMFAETGACATFVGPLGWFQQDPQFNVTNFTWSRIYD